MANNARRPAISSTSRAQEVERKNQALSYLANQRSSFAINILCNMVRGAITNRDCTNMDCKGLVDLSVEMADHLMDKLYSVNEEGR